MSYPPPPNNQNDPYFRGQEDEQGTINIPGVGKINLKQIARAYMEHRGIIKWGTKLAGYKIPTELDEGLEAIAFGYSGNQPDRNYEQSYPQRGYPQEGGIEAPPSAIGERVMTDEMAYEAWRLNKGIGTPRNKRYGLQEIADYFTNQGSPISKATVRRYVDDIDEDIRQNKHAWLRPFAKYGLVAGLWLASLLFFKFIL